MFYVITKQQHVKDKVRRKFLRFNLFSELSFLNCIQNKKSEIMCSWLLVEIIFILINLSFKSTFSMRFL